VSIEFSDGSSADYRAIPAILETGVLVNWRVEGADEIRNWLQGNAHENLRVVSLRFRSDADWAWMPVLEGVLEEGRWEDTRTNADADQR
jgi:hypothetical protein